MNESKTIQIRLDLKGDIAEKFMQIKKRYGLESNTDLLRLLISKTYEELNRENR